MGAAHDDRRFCLGHGWAIVWDGTAASARGTAEQPARTRAQGQRIKRLELSIKRALTNNLSVKLAAVVVAVLLWLFAKGEQIGVREFSIPLIPRNIPGHVTTVQRIPATMDVALAGPNKELVKAGLWSDPYAVIDLGQAKAGRALRVGLSAANVVLPRGADVHVVEVLRPKGLDLEIDEKAQRRVQVVPAVAGELPDGWYLLGEPVAVPDSVMVFGPRQKVNELVAVQTLPLDVSGRRASVEASRAIDVSGEWNFHAVPKEVRLSVQIEGTKLATIAGVPVRFDHEPGFEEASIEPQAADITLRGPEHTVLALGSDDLAVVVDARGLPRGQHHLVPDVAVRDELVVVSVSPMRFTVILR